MRIQITVVVTLLASCDAFVSPSQRASSRGSFSLKAFDSADSLLDKIGQADLTTVTAPPPPPAAPIEAVIPTAAEVAATAPEPIKAAATEVVKVAPDAATSALDFSDVHVVPIAVGALLVVAAVSFMSGGGDEGESSTASSSSASVSTIGEDVSIPYDAAAKLAYEKAGKPGDYPSFKTKYEADAVAEVKAKQKK